MEPDLLPDIEEVLCQWLATRSELSGVSIGTRVPLGYNGTQKVVRIVRLGGGADFLMRFDSPRLDIDTFGPDKGSAADLMKILRRLMLFDIHTADLSAWQASISHTREDVGPIWLDEPDYPNASRYLLQMTVMVHSA